MKQPEDLRNVSEKVLYGLTADDSLKFRILQSVSSKSSAKRKFAFISPVPVLCSLLAVLMISIFALNRLAPIIPSDPGEMNVFAAGSNDFASQQKNSSVSFYTEIAENISPEDVVMIEVSDLGQINEASICSELFNILVSSAIPVSEVDMMSTAEMIITTSEGKKIRFNIAEPYLICDTCWSCPEYFRMIRSILHK